MKKLSKINIEIEVDLINKFQKDFAVDSLEIMLKSWESYIKSRSKRNEIDWNIDYFYDV